MKKLKELMLNQLKQGATPEGLALTIAVGFAIGCFPIVGATTLMCVAAGAIWKLNQPILQTVNYLLSPVQLAAIPILMYAGAALYGVEHVSINPLTMFKEFSDSPLVFLQKYGWAAGQAVSVWVLIAPVIVFVSFKILKPIFRRLQQRFSSANL